MITALRFLAALLLAPVCACNAPSGAAPGGAGAATANLAGTTCLPSGDGYLRASVAGSVEAHIDWPNSGTRCEGESRVSPPGVHLAFQRAGSNPDLLLVFGLSGVRRGEPAHEIGVNLTVFVQGTSQVFGTLGDTRCTIDSLSQRPLAGDSFRIEARGFCTQPAHAVRGEGDVLVSTFEFAGPVTYLPDNPPPNTVAVIKP
jgi:hypothetical protein